MGTTTNYGWNYGTRGQNPWWTEWAAIFQAIDTTMLTKADLVGCTFTGNVLFTGAVGSYAQLSLQDLDGTLPYYIRQTSDLNGDATLNDILQIGSNVSAGGAQVIGSQPGVYLQWERDFLSIGRRYSEWHVNHIMTDGTIKRTLQSSIDSVSANGLINITNAILQQNTFSDLDYSTAMGGTNATSFSNFGLAQVTLTATNAGVTRTEASTIYIAGPPIEGLNTTITNPWALKINNGYQYINTGVSGGLYIGGSAMQSAKPPFSLAIEGQTVLGGTPSTNLFSSDAYQLILGSGVGNNGMTIFSGVAGTGNIYFADANVNNANNRIGQIVYDHSTNVMSIYIGAAECVRITENQKIGGSAERATTEGTHHLDIFDGTAPAGTLANGCSIYSAAGELFTMDAAGNATLQTPHDDKGEWVFYSKNTVTGKTLKIDMERMMRKLNDMLGGDFIHEFMEEVTP